MKLSENVKVVIICGLTGKQLSEKEMKRNEVKEYLDKNLGVYEDYAIFKA